MRTLSASMILLFLVLCTTSVLVITACQQSGPDEIYTSDRYGQPAPDPNDTSKYVILRSQAELADGELLGTINQWTDNGYTLHSLIPMSQSYGYVAVMERKED